MRLEALVRKVDEDGDFGLDPATIILIISVLVEIAKCIYDKKLSTDDIFGICDKPFDVNRARVKAFFRLRLGRRYNKQFVNQLFDTVAKRCNYSNVKALVNDGVSRH